jgi:NAD(P)-dependent dehydrogenase (short-subunit alcohol dehydrogenase family)
MMPRPDHGEHSYRGNGKLNGRVALITGADSGIGRAVAIAFAREGADVLVSCLCEDQEAQETAHWVEEAGRRALTIAGDVADPMHCRQLVNRALQAFGRLDILVNNAAFQATHESIEEITDEEWDHTFRTNHLQHVLPGQGGGAIPQAGQRHCQYRLDKLEIAVSEASRLRDHERGNRQFHRGACPASRRQGNSGQLCRPGPIWTPLIPSTMPPEKVAHFGENTPLKRPGQPAELAPAYVLLASDEGSYMSGAMIPVTGGRPML